MKVPILKVNISIFAFVLFFIGCNNNPDPKQASTDYGWDTVAASFYLNDSIHHGEATFYGIAGEGGNCSLPSPSPWDTMAGAMNHTDYRNSEVCGAYVMVSGPKDSVLIRINDQCPECKEGDVDLTPNAFERIGPKEMGRMPITWHFVPGPVTGGILLNYVSGSSIYWAGIQVRNHLTPIRAMEVLINGSIWRDITRKPYNHFEATEMPQPPWIIRIRDVFGSEIVDSTVPILNGNDYNFEKQFAFPEK